MTWQSNPQDVLVCVRLKLSVVFSSEQSQDSQDVSWNTSTAYVSMVPRICKYNENIIPHYAKYETREVDDIQWNAQNAALWHVRARDDLKTGQLGKECICSNIYILERDRQFSPTCYQINQIKQNL